MNIQRSKLLNKNFEQIKAEKDIVEKELSKKRSDLFCIKVQLWLDNRESREDYRKRHRENYMAAVKRKSKMRKKF